MRDFGEKNLSNNGVNIWKKRDRKKWKENTTLGENSEPAKGFRAEKEGVKGRVAGENPRSKAPRKIKSSKKGNGDPKKSKMFRTKVSRRMTRRAEQRNIAGIRTVRTCR